MKSVYISRRGGPEVLELRQAPDPEPGPGQVRVRVRAAGVNFADIMMRMGLYPGAPKIPFVPGYEAAGVIDKVGSAVKNLAPGAEVVVATNYGGYSDTLIAGANQVFTMPAGKSFEAGAALMVNYLTAYEALVHQGNLHKGQTVLVHGAAGGVGIAAVQIARLSGARIFGTASASKHDFLRKHGVEACIDYNREDFERSLRGLTGGRGADVILDPVGGDSFRKSYRSLAPAGKLIVYGLSSAAGGKTRSLPRVVWQYLRTPNFSALDLMNANKGVIGIHLGRMTDQKDLLAGHIATLVRWWGEGRIEPLIARTFPLESAGRAHEFIQDRKNIGKVVLTV